MSIDWHRLGSLLAVASFILIGSPIRTNSVKAQTAPIEFGSFEEQSANVASDIKTWPQLGSLPTERRRDAVVFVFGNLLFAVFHEMGHAVISEMQLPVLGREEDAADSFATIAGTRMMTDITEQALIEAGKGWFFNDLSKKKNGIKAEFYESHGFDLQRAYQIVCVIVGANPEKYKILADATKLPSSRQKECVEEYAITAWSWETLLEPHRRKSQQPPTEINVIYNEGVGVLDGYAKVFKDLQFLERIAAMASKSLVWRSPFSMQMETCGHPNAFWSVKNRKLQVCYELVATYLNLYVRTIVDPTLKEQMDSFISPEVTRLSSGQR